MSYGKRYWRWNLMNEAIRLGFWAIASGFPALAGAAFELAAHHAHAARREKFGLLLP